MMDGQINNLKLQLKNIDSQFNIFEMQNRGMMGGINQKSQIMNIAIQILNIGIQTLNYAETFMRGMGENISDLESQIQEISKQLDNMYPKNPMMNMMTNNMGMNMMNNNMGMNMMNNNKDMGMMNKKDKVESPLFNDDEEADGIQNPFLKIRKNSYNK